MDSIDDLVPAKTPAGDEYLASLTMYLRYDLASLTTIRLLFSTLPWLWPRLPDRRQQIAHQRSL